MNRSTAYLLIAHGSRDPRPHQAVDALAHAFWEQLCQQPAEPSEKIRPAPSHGLTPKGTRPVSDLPPAMPVVGTATLELGTVPLHQQIEQFARRAAAAGHQGVNLVPLFLLPGVHVMEDLPAQVAIAQQILGDGIDLQVLPHIGGSRRLSHLVQFSSTNAAARILLAHGTKRPSGNQSIEAIAASHQATSAYWAVEPGLGDCVQTLVNSGHQQIEIQPYFLFPGGITDAIAQQVEQLAAEHATTAFHLLPPLGMTPALTDILLEMAIAPGSSSLS